MSVYPALNFDWEERSDVQTFDFEYENGQEIDVDFGAVSVIEAGTRGHFEGPYVVDPMFVEQVLDTEQKIMDADVTVKPIRVEYVSNSSGGDTVYIGV